MNSGMVVWIGIEDFEVDYKSLVMNLKSDVRKRCSEADMILYKNRVVKNNCGDIGEIKLIEVGE